MKSKKRGCFIPNSTKASLKRKAAAATTAVMCAAPPFTRVFASQGMAAQSTPAVVSSANIVPKNRVAWNDTGNLQCYGYTDVRIRYSADVYVELQQYAFWGKLYYFNYILTHTS